jgi:AbiTii
MLIDEIIDLLGDTKSNLTEALLKTKIFLHQISRKELTEWVNNELDGYPKGSEVPGYRIVHTRVLANVSNPLMRYTSHPIPLGHLKPEQRDPLERSDIRDGLAVVEEFATRKGHLARSIPMEANGLLSKGLGRSFNVEHAWCEINIPDMKGILVQVRSRLLDFLLELRGSLGEPTTESEVKQKASTVDATSMFNNAIFGSNATIVVGHHVRQTVHNETMKGDLGKLTAALKQIGVPDDEIENLEAAVEQDEVSSNGPSFGGETGRWYTRLLARAAERGLGIGVEAVSTEVAKLLGNYFGS